MVFSTLCYYGYVKVQSWMPQNIAMLQITDHDKILLGGIGKRHCIYNLHSLEKETRDSLASNKNVFVSKIM
jgi:hypothetical protein